MSLPLQAAHHGMASSQASSSSHLDAPDTPLMPIQQQPQLLPTPMPQPGQPQQLQPGQPQPQQMLMQPALIQPPSYENANQETEEEFAAPAIRASPANGDKDTPISYLLLCKLAVKVEIYMSTAFVTLDGVWKNHTDEEMDCVLEIPLNQKCTATSCVISIGDRILETMVVPTDEAEEYQSASPETGQAEYQKYNPDYFFLPFEGVKPGEEIKITFIYFESLMFIQGAYRSKLPMRFRPEMLPPNPLQEIIQLRCSINAGTQNASWGSASHQLTCVSQTESFVEVHSDPSIPWENHHFDISFSLWHQTILASSLNISPTSTEPKGSFSIFLTPPELGVYPAFGRRIIFILDKSGSMTGPPMESARNALTYGISMLGATDFFTVIAFSEHQYYFSQALVPANQENQAAAISWVQNIQAAGLTDILTPLRAAVNILEESHHHPATKGTVPFIFLITDGAVRNERDICLYTRSLQTSIRINTFGIGLFCNHFFLKMLAQIGRGFCEVSYKSSEVYQQMIYLLGMANAPVLADVRIGVSRTAENIEIFPYPIPDLFCGAPLILSGKYTGRFPDKISILGLLSNGEKFKSEVPVISNSNVPIDRIFVKQQLDLLTAQAWLTDSRKTKNQIIEISCRESMPCAHTTMVAYEVPKGDKAKYERKKMEDKRYRRNVLLAVGGIVVIGVAAAAFGDVFGTMSNIPVGDAVGALSGSGDCANCGDCATGGECGGGDCHGDCGDCHGDCGDCHGDCGGCDCQC